LFRFLLAARLDLTPNSERKCCFLFVCLNLIVTNAHTQKPFNPHIEERKPHRVRMVIPCYHYYYTAS